MYEHLRVRSPRHARKLCTKQVDKGLARVVIPTPFNYFCFLVLRPGEAGAQHQKKKFGGGFAAPEPPLWGSILTDLV